MTTPHLIAPACTASDPEAPYRHAELAVWDEWLRSLAEYPTIWRSYEEGAAVLGEKVDDLWDEVRANHIGRARAEAAQVGAMAVRFIADLCEPAGAARVRGRTAVADAQAVRSMVGPHGRMLASSHEGFGFLKREYDALWSAVRFDDPVRELAARVAWMSVRFIAEMSSATVAAMAPVRMSVVPIRHGDSA
ncbi:MULTISPECIES: hypothetical protein [Mycobacteriaceae]|uniref:hypothetical protein n=1 Tax=Mycobacteriaceae TaxID=1762 RepID=UPI0007E9FF73|nr:MULTISPECIES: hypothetical protein [Mycobacteriaceae]OBF76113.1 hypothetical protein A5751_24565 [Mycolicibacterium fortuitum]